MFKKILHCGGENNSIIQVCSKKSFIVMGKIAQGTALQERVLKTISLQCKKSAEVAH